jgi:hypothetical protein
MVSEGFGGAGCSASVNTYAPFNLAGIPSVSFSPSAENPIGVAGGPGITYSAAVCNYNGSICNPGSFPVDAPVTSSFTGPFCPSASASGGGPWNPGTTTTLNGSCTPTAVNGGDTYCVVVDIAYTAGYVNTANPGDVVGANTSGHYPNCQIVHNDPFFKMFNSSISAGSSFAPGGGGACTGGELAGWNNNTGTNPSSEDFGAGAQLSTLAALGITGVASNQTVPPTLNGPATNLSFANNGVPVSSSIDSPALGGNFGNNAPCLTTPAPPTPGPGVDSTSYGSSQPIGPLTILPGDNKSIFVNGDVYIAGNILYKGDNGLTGRSAAWNSTKDVSSFTLYATGNIYIDPSVTELDGVYSAQPASASAGGKIYTCGLSSYTPMAKDNLYGSCHNQLTVYGNFVANQVNMMRTFGSLRDDTPTTAGTTTVTTENPHIGFVWSQTNSKPGMNCQPFNEGSEPSSHGWFDNFLCQPASNPGFCVESGTPYPCTNCNFYWIDPGGNPYYSWLPSYWQDNAMCFNPQFVHPYDQLSLSWGPPPAGSTVPPGDYHTDTINGQQFANHYYTPGNTSYCTLLYEDSDPTPYRRDPGPAGWRNLVWEHTYLCEPVTTSTTTVPVAGGQPYPRTCSNGGALVVSQTCAAEVFYLSPELYLSNPAISPPSNGALQYKAVTGLPPVL